MKKWAGLFAVFAIVLVLVLFLPIPQGTYDDGGTRDYNALTYKIVAWNRIMVEPDENGEARHGTYHNTSVYWYPDNHKTIDELWQMEMASAGIGAFRTETESTDTPADTSDNTAPAANGSITAHKAWSGEFSEEKLRTAINEYKSECNTLVLENDSISTVSFKVDHSAKSCSVVRLSPVDDSNIELELSTYIDTFLETKCEGDTVSIPVDWWCRDNGGVTKDRYVWSYLVRVQDADGGEHYYYFRVDYSGIEK